MKKIAIVGTSQSSCHLAPYNDPSWAIWTLGQGIWTAPRFDQHFELHRRDVLEVYPNLDPARFPDGVPYFKRLNEIGAAAMVGYEHADYPKATLFPREAVMDKLASRYFTSSLAWMIAFAISLGADEIGLWGVDMVCNDEWGYQRPCCEYWLGRAEGMGIKVTVAKESPIMRADRMYAFESVGIARELGERKLELAAEIRELEQAEKNLAFKRGAMAILDSLEGRWG